MFSRALLFALTLVVMPARAQDDPADTGHGTDSAAPPTTTDTPPETDTEATPGEAQNQKSADDDATPDPSEDVPTTRIVATPVEPGATFDPAAELRYQECAALLDKGDEKAAHLCFEGIARAWGGTEAALKAEVALYVLDKPRLQAPAQAGLIPAGRGPRTRTTAASSRRTSRWPPSWPRATRSAAPRSSSPRTCPSTRPRPAS
jgi:hypothetical protein